MQTMVRVSCYGYHGLRTPQQSQIQWITLIAFPHWTKVYTTRPNPILSRDVRREGHSQDTLTNLAIMYDRMGGSEKGLQPSPSQVEAGAGVTEDHGAAPEAGPPLQSQGLELPVQVTISLLTMS